MTPNQYTPEEPISSIATALAPAALGIVRVSGKGCIELVSRVFSRPKALLEAAGNTLVYGWIQEGGGSTPLAPTAADASFSATLPAGDAPATPPIPVLHIPPRPVQIRWQVQFSRMPDLKGLFHNMEVPLDGKLHCEEDLPE